MTDLFSGITNRLQFIKKDTWYSKDNLRALHINSDAFKEENKEILTKRVHGNLQILGASVLYHYDQAFSLHSDMDWISEEDLAFALSNPNIHQYIEDHPEVRYSERVMRKFQGQHRRHSYNILSKFLNRFKEFVTITREKEPTHDDQKLYSRFLPEFDLDFKTLAYISNHRDESVEQLAKKTRKNPTIIKGALGKLGYIPAQNLDEVVGLGRKILNKLHPSSTPWTDEEHEKLKAGYFFLSPNHIASLLNKDKEDVEYEAKLLNLKRFEPHKEYRISEIVRISGIPYHDFQQALFQNVLPHIRNAKDSDDKMIKGAFLFEGDDLLHFFKGRTLKKGEQLVKTRADEYFLGHREKSNRKKTNSIQIRANSVERKRGSLEEIKTYASWLPLLTEEEEKDLCERKDSDLLARNDLIESNLPLAIWSANHHYLPKGMEFNDAFQETILGLIKGADYYDPNKAKERGDIKERYRFSTYANLLMQQALRKSVRDSYFNLIRLPENTQDYFAKLEKVMKHFTDNFEREPSIKEIQRATGASKGLIKSILNARKRVIRSLEEEIGENMNFGDTIAQQTSSEYALTEVSQERQIKIDEALNHLSQREKRVLKSRYGLNGTKHLTLDEIGKILRLSRERIRQIEIGALEKLQYNPILEKLIQ